MKGFATETPREKNCNLSNSAPLRLCGQRELPRNISAHPAGYLVRVKRKGITYSAFVGKGFATETPSTQREKISNLCASAPLWPTALLEAVRLRDRFIHIHGAIAVRGPSKKAYSNTGLVGISETIHWNRSRRNPCFLVSCRRHFRRRIYYGEHRPRAVALKMAIELRTEKIAREVAKAAKGGTCQ